MIRKDTILGLLLAAASALAAASCVKNDLAGVGDDMEGSVSLNLHVSLLVPTDGVPAREEVEKLRVIVIDDATGAVEFNKVFDKPEFVPVQGSQYRYTYALEETVSSSAGTKSLYAIANAEEQIRDIVAEGNTGKQIVAGLNGLELTGIDSGSIPIASRQETVTLSAASSRQSVVMAHADIVMAYAAVKFDFKFINDFSTRQDVHIVGWQIDKVATKSYLIPRMEDEAWRQLIALGGTVDDDGWVTDYKLPSGTVHDEYTRDYPKPLPLVYGAQAEDPTTYYLNESRYFGEFGALVEQEYYFILRIRLADWEEDSPPIILSCKLPNLKSLVRGTHVDVEATLKNMPDMGDNSLEVRVRTWINDDTVDGGWEEVAP